MATPTNTGPGAKLVELDPTGALLYQAYVSLGHQIAELETKRGRIREQLEARIGDAPGASIGGRKVISYAWSQPGTMLDVKALAKDHPDIYAQYLRQKKAARPFKLVEG